MRNENIYRITLKSTYPDNDYQYTIYRDLNLGEIHDSVSETWNQLQQIERLAEQIREDLRREQKDKLYKIIAIEEVQTKNS